MKKNGVLARTTKPHIIRFSPPLVIDDSQVEKVSEVFKIAANEI